MKNQEDEFYFELDRKKLHRSCCTAPTMIIFFVFILIVIIFGALYGLREIKKINFSSKVIQSTFQDKENFYNKLNLNSRQENFEITITSEELTAVISEGITFKNFIIKNNQAIIQENGIDFYGTLVKPLSSSIQIKTVPKVENSKIKFEVEQITAGKLKMPKLINNQVADTLNKTMDEKFQSLYNQSEVQNISLFDDKMVISGKIK